jgi:lipid-binding SYLF domain-containing protein
MRIFKQTLLILFTATLFVSTADAGWNPFKSGKSNAAKRHEVKAAIARFKAKDPSMKVYFQKAYGYAIFPTVGKGGIGVGGAYGKGQVYRGGKYIGRTTLTQVTIGFQLGGQAYSEIIFFKDRKAFNRFIQGDFKLSAQASAVAATAGAAANADYSNGVAIFTITKGGLMYEASVGGQKFSFTPVK